MRQPNNREGEITGTVNSLNSAINHHHHHQLLSSLQHIHNHNHSPLSNFDPASSHNDFLDQMLSSSAFPWSDDQSPPDVVENLGHQPTSNGAVKAMMLQQQQQLLLSTGLVEIDDSPNLSNDASIKAFINGFTGSPGQSPNISQHFHHPQNFEAAAASGSSGGEAAGQPKQRVRARRGHATDPHSIAERLRRERIAERMKSLQELVPNANKTDKASMLDEIIDYVKFLQLQVKVLSMSRLGGAAAVSPLVDDKSPEGKSGASSSNNEGMTVAERQVAKLLEDDMGSAMQYLQGKGLCLMPISLATAISTATSQSRNPSTTTSNNNPFLNGEVVGPTSPSISVLTAQSTAIGGDVKDVPKIE